MAQPLSTVHNRWSGHFLRVNIDNNEPLFGQKVIPYHLLNLLKRFWKLEAAIYDI
jgi:hypothetical protein